MTHSVDRVLKVWNVASRREVARVGGFAHEGRNFYFGRANDSIWRFDVASGRNEEVLPRAGLLLGVQPDGRHVVVLGGDGLPTLVPTTGARASADGAAGAAASDLVAVLSRDGRRLALTSPRHPKILVFELEPRRLVAAFEDPRPVIALALSPDGERLVSSGFDGVLKSWDVAGGRLARAIRASLDPVWAMDFSRDGRELATAGNDRGIKIWDTTTWDEKAALRGHEDTIWTVAFSPDSRQLASAGQEEAAMLWSTEPRHAPEEMRRLLRGPNWSDRIPHLAFSPDSALFAGTAADGTVHVWDTATVQLRAAIPVDARTVAFSADGGDVLAEGYDGGVQRWNLGRKQFGEPIVPAPPETNRSSAMSAAERVAVVGGRLSRGVKSELCAITSTRDAVVAGEMSAAHTVALTAAGDRMFLGLSDGTLEAWEVASRTRRLSIAAHKLPVTAVAVSPDGRYVASGGLDNLTKLWRAADGQLLATFTAHNRPVWALAFSPDSQTLATGSCDKAVMLCSVPLRRTVMQLWLYRGEPAGYEQEVRLLRFSPDGNLLAAALGDGSVRFFRAAAFDEAERSR